MTIAEDLSIVVSASPTDPAKYIDVPLDHIGNVSLESTLNTQSQSLSYVVLIELSPTANTYLCNAIRSGDSSVLIAFISESHAKTVLKLLQRRTTSARQGKNFLMAEEPIECSSRTPDHDLSGPASTSHHRQGLEEIVQRAATILPEDIPINPTSSIVNGADTLPRVVVAEEHESGTGLRPDADGGKTRVSVTAWRLIEDIDCSLPHPATDTPLGQDLTADSADSFGAQAKQDDSGGIEQTTHSPMEGVWDTELPHSIPWQTGLLEIDNAPEFRELENREFEQATKLAKSPQDRPEDYDSSYDISPRPLRDANRKLHSTTQQQSTSYPLIKARENVKPRATEGALSEKTTPFKSSQVLRSGHQDANATADSPNGAEPAIEAGDHPIPNTTRQTMKQSKAEVPAKSKRHPQKIQPQKKATACRIKVIGATDMLGIRNDGADVPRTLEAHAVKLGETQSSIKTAANGGIYQANAVGEGGQELSKSKSRDKSLPASRHLLANGRSMRTSTMRPETLAGCSKAEAGGQVEDDSIWDLDPEASDECQIDSSRQRMKASSMRKQPAKVRRDGKPTKAPIKAKRLYNQQEETSTEPSRNKDPDSARLSAETKQPLEMSKKQRPRRDAAKRANERILRVSEINEIDDEDRYEEPATKPQKVSPLLAVKQTPRSSHVRQLESSFKQGTARALRPDEEATQFPKVDKNKKTESPVGSSSGLESLGKIKFVTTLSRPGRKQAGTNPKASTSAREASSSSCQSKGRSLEKAITAVAKYTSSSDKRMTHWRSTLSPERQSVPDNVRAKSRAAEEAEPNVMFDAFTEDSDELEHVQMVGDAEDRHFQEGLPNRETVDEDDAQRPPEKNRQSLQIAEHGAILSSDSNLKDKMLTKSNGRRLQGSIENIRPISKALQPKGNKHAPVPRDPFSDKLGLLACKTDVASIHTREAGIARASKSSEAGEESKEHSEIEEDAAVESLRRVKSIRQPVYSIRPGNTKDTMAPENPYKNVPTRAAEQHNSETLKEDGGGSDRAKPARREGRANQDIRRHSGHAAESNINNCNGTPVGHRVPNLTTVQKDDKPAHVELDDAQDTPLPKYDRKPELISFSTSGPRNQGKASIKKSKPSNTQRMCEAFSDGPTAPKRKIALEVGNPAPSECERLTKHQKRDVTPTHRHKHIAQMIPGPVDAVVQRKSQRPSSQSTRVDENGSPMPVLHIQNCVSASLEKRSGYYHVKNALENAQLEDDDDEIVAHDGNDWKDLNLPLARSSNSPLDEIEGITNMSNNTRHQPSSPHAPSALTTLPAHHLYRDGKIVNPQTTEKIVPTELQDPFLGGEYNHTSSFIETLRKLSDKQVQCLRNGINQQPSPGLLKRSFLHAEDPEKTLVEPEPARKRRHIRLVPTIGSSPEFTTSEATSPSQDVSRHKTDDEISAACWKAYEPHQSNMLDALSNLTHVSR